MPTLRLHDWALLGRGRGYVGLWDGMVLLPTWMITMRAIEAITCSNLPTSPSSSFLSTDILCNGGVKRSWVRAREEKVEWEAGIEATILFLLIFTLCIALPMYDDTFSHSIKLYGITHFLLYFLFYDYVWIALTLIIHHYNLWAKWQKVNFLVLK